MIEVFKTNVKDQDVADKLTDHIHRNFIGYKANFDLQDCDHILRVKSVTGSIESTHIIYLLNEYGCTAEILQDEINQFTGIENV